MVFVTFSSLSSFEDDGLSSFNIPNGDKIVHFVFYFVATILGSLYLVHRDFKKQNTRKSRTILAFSLIIFGIIIEVIQEKMTANRSGELLDALANSAGVILGFLFILARFHGQRGLK
ncbi:hypothetical protein FB2170_03010 [Maribacter sp. HTCC2170]|nr:hypothetical protein FB2170_03010 [Maribacter sp. HTCC2170]